MMLVATVANHQRTTTPHKAAFGIDLLKRLAQLSLPLPMSTIRPGANRRRRYQPRFHQLLTEFEAITGCPVLINTSFNVRVNRLLSPEDAYNCFMNTGIDRLVIGNYLLKKEDQPSTNVPARQFELD